jgi:hypothetical protein
MFFRELLERYFDEHIECPYPSVDAYINAYIYNMKPIHHCRHIENIENIHAGTFRHTHTITYMHMNITCIHIRLQEKEKERLARVLGLKREQVGYWFNNARKRFLFPAIKKVIVQCIQTHTHTHTHTHRRTYTHTRIHAYTHTHIHTCTHTHTTHTP